MVPVAGVEPARGISPMDFEFCTLSGTGCTLVDYNGFCLSTNMTNTELQLKSLEKILIARRARSSYEPCFVISFLINHKTGSTIRLCLPD